VSLDDASKAVIKNVLMYHQPCLFNTGIQPSQCNYTEWGPIKSSKSLSQYFYLPQSEVAAMKHDA
jgi:hypothetical protein